MSLTGWCQSRQHGICRFPAWCDCVCHAGQGETGIECVIMERSRKVRKHPAAPNPALLDMTERRS